MFQKEPMKETGNLALRVNPNNQTIRFKGLNSVSQTNQIMRANWIVASRKDCCCLLGEGSLRKPSRRMNQIDYKRFKLSSQNWDRERSCWMGSRASHRDRLFVAFALGHGSDKLLKCSKALD